MDAPRPPGRLKVALLSLPPRTQAMLDFFISNSGRSTFATALEDQADAAVFDHDHPDSRAHWQRFHAARGRPGIMLSIQPAEVQATVAVAKPITPAALLNAAARLAAGDASRAAAPAVAPAAVPPAAQPAMAPVAMALAASMAAHPPAAATPAALPAVAAAASTAAEPVIISPAPALTAEAQPAAPPAPQGEIPADAQASAQPETHPETQPEPSASTEVDAGSSATAEVVSAPESAAAASLSATPVAAIPTATAASPAPSAIPSPAPATSTATSTAAAAPADTHAAGRTGDEARPVKAVLTPGPVPKALPRTTGTAPAMASKSASPVASAATPPVKAAASSTAAPARPSGLGQKMGGFLRKIFVGDAPAPAAAPSVSASVVVQPASTPARVIPASSPAAAGKADTPAPVDDKVAAPQAVREVSPSAQGPATGATVIALAGGTKTSPAGKVTASAAPASPAPGAHKATVTVGAPTRFYPAATSAPASAPAPAQSALQNATHKAGPAKPVSLAASSATPPAAPAKGAGATNFGAGLAGQAGAAWPDEALLCGQREDLPTPRWNSDTGLRYEPADHLVGVLREAWQVSAKWRVPTQIDIAPGRVMVDAALAKVHFGFDLKLLPALWNQPLARRPKLRSLNRQESRDAEALFQQAEHTLRLDQLLWRGGMLSAAGRLPQGVEPSRTVYLRHWPNFTRLERLPQAVRVAALWATRGASIVETAKLVNLPQRQVIALYNGMAALGLVTEDGSHIRRSQRRHQNRGLLTRLLGWLQH